MAGFIRNSRNPGAVPPMTEAGKSSFFPTTIWSEILPRGSGAGDSAAALDALARRYALPIREYLRAALRKDGEEASDLAQDFFVWMIETAFLAKADPERGRFRAFLKTALRHYAADEDRKKAAQRRGGDRRIVPIGDEDGPALAARAEASPDEALDRAFRAEVVRQALGRVEESLRREGKEAVFSVFRDYFLDPEEKADYREIAARHGLSTADVSNHLQRAKALYRSALRAIVLETVRSAGELEDELLWLFGRAPGGEGAPKAT